MNIESLVKDLKENVSREEVANLKFLSDIQKIPSLEHKVYF